MIYSLSYKCNQKQEAQEIKCLWNQLGEIWDLIKENKDKRINIILTPDADLKKVFEQVEIIKSAVENNYTLAAAGLSQLQTLKKEGYQSYVMMPVTDWETLDVLLSLGVSDVYIDGPLGFDLKEVAKKVHAAGALIRITPHVSPNIAALPTGAAHSFFIRPEDIDLYSPYIDILEFFTEDKKKEDTLFSIYSKKEFLLSLSLLIDNFDFQVLNSLIRPEFAEHRLDCQQKCLIPGHSCHLCENELIFSQSLERLAKSADSDLI